MAKGKAVKPPEITYTQPSLSTIPHLRVQPTVDLTYPENLGSVIEHA